MEAKRLDFKQSVHALCTQYLELIGLLAEIGFQDITKPGILMSAGRFMTIPKGVALKKLDMGNIIRQLAENGFSVDE